MRNANTWAGHASVKNFYMSMAASHEMIVRKAAAQVCACQPFGTTISFYAHVAEARATIHTPQCHTAF